MQYCEVCIPSGSIELAATLYLPRLADESPLPVVVLVGGSLSHLRNGGYVEPGRFVPPRTALKRLGERLAVSGYGAISWDKRGYGQTPAGEQPVSFAVETADLIAVMRYLRNQPWCGNIVLLGESAGAYLICRAARQGEAADAYIFLGALGSSVESLFAYNYGKLYNYARANKENWVWAEKNAPLSLEMGKRYGEMLAAARRGVECYLLARGKHKRLFPLVKIREELLDPPLEQFRYIKGPVLLLHGEQDMNVPPGDARLIGEVLGAAGNQQVTCLIIPCVDHSFQIAPADEDLRIRERHTFESFRRPYSEDLYHALLAWLRQVVPTTRQCSNDGLAGVPDGKGVVERTVWDGVKILSNGGDLSSHRGVETLEGRIGPMLSGQGISAHFIEMPSGLYCSEHYHLTESIIFTVRGKWVLASGGHRLVMHPGSLFWFGEGVPTGYEVPFEQPALLLVFKGQANQEAAFRQYLVQMAEQQQKEQSAGRPFRLSLLPDVHPARVFAGLLGWRGE